MAMLGALIAALSQPAWAGTTVADFLKWGRKGQRAFLTNAVSMTGVIASQIQPEFAQCLDDWYFKSEALAEQRNAEMIEAMEQYSNYDPQAFVLAYLESTCSGGFER